MMLRDSLSDGRIIPDSGFEVHKFLKKDENTANIPIIFLSVKSSSLNIKNELKDVIHFDKLP